MSDSLVTVNNTQLASYGGRDVLKELGDRLRKMMPGTTTFTESEALTVAQVALAHDLDPFNGEVWGIKSDDKWYGVMVGIKGLRKSANREAIRLNFTYWTEFIQIEPAEAGAGKDSIVYKCVIRDTQSMQSYGKSINILTTSGVPYSEAIAMVGKAPQVIGIGIATPGERSKMAIHQRARKRAEADAIKQKFDLQFQGAAVDTTGIVDDAIEGSFTDVSQSDTQQPDRTRNTSQILAELGFEDQPAPAPSTEAVSAQPAKPTNGNGNNGDGKVVLWLVSSGLAENEFSARGMLTHYGKPRTTTEEKTAFMTWARLYRGWRNVGADSHAAAENAHMGEDAPVAEDSQP